MVNHFSQLGIRNATLNPNTVPVFFVRVITRRDLLVTIAQLERQIRVALQVHSGRHFVQRCQSEHFTADFEHENIGPAWRALGCAWFAQTVFAELREIHQASRSWKIAGKSLIATRSCFIESRSRHVTVSSSPETFYPDVSESTVSRREVPISS